MMDPIEMVSRLFRQELENVAKLYPGYDPFKGHRPGDAGGKSTFAAPYDPGTWVEPDEAVVDEAVKETDSVRILKIAFEGIDSEPGLYQGLASRGEWTVGTVRETRAKHDYRTIDVKIERVHGCLQPVAYRPDDWVVAEDEVTHATAVLTKETAKDGTEMWCLASAYPGDPGAGPEQWAAFKEGDKVQLDPCGGTAVVRDVIGADGSYTEPEGLEVDIRHVVLSQGD